MLMAPMAKNYNIQGFRVVYMMALKIFNTPASFTFQCFHIFLCSFMGWTYERVSHVILALTKALRLSTLFLIEFYSFFVPLIVPAAGFSCYFSMAPLIFFLFGQSLFSTLLISLFCSRQEFLFMFFVVLFPVFRFCAHKKLIEKMRIKRFGRKWKQSLT